MIDTIREAILKAIPNAEVSVLGGSPGHYEIRVVAEAFKGKSMIQQQQLVYGAIAHLMKGEGAPVHAVDRLQTVVP